jgi:hypothetical protein
MRTSKKTLLGLVAVYISFYREGRKESSALNVRIAGYYLRQITSVSQRLVGLSVAERFCRFRIKSVIRNEH